EVPFFRAVYDNVQMARPVSDLEFPQPDQRAWAEAVSVFTFGHLPSIGWSTSELGSLMEQRFAMGVLELAGSIGQPCDSGADAGNGPPGGGNGGGGGAGKGGPGGPPKTFSSGSPGSAAGPGGVVADSHAIPNCQPAEFQAAFLQFFTGIT